MGVVDRKREEEKSGLSDCSKGSAPTVTDRLAD